MDIYHALQSKHIDVRVTCPHRWLVWDENLCKWVVREQLPYKKKCTILYEGNMLSDALIALVRTGKGVS